MNRSHGFAWPEGLPACALCDRPASDSVHVTPARIRPLLWQASADRSTPHNPVRAHAYTSRSQLASKVRCVICQRPLSDPIHGVGMPSATLQQFETGPGIADTTPPERAFVAEIGHRLVFAAPMSTDFSVKSLPQSTAGAFQRASAQNPNNLWIAGRYVEADRPNRNAAFWSTEDLELGEPTVAHGPINWLHEERHVIGSIAASELVKVDRQAAASGDVGNHIVVLGAIWPYIWPQEARLVQQASEQSKLYFSMECVSKEVACLTCDKTLPYRDYMQKAARCEHMNERLPRRFVEPTFGGAAVIVPPVRPGWANADARVLMPQAAALVEREAAAFAGLPSADAELVAATIIANATVD